MKRSPPDGEAGNAHDADVAQPQPLTTTTTTTAAIASSLGHAARKARLDDGSNAALELGIDTDDELEAEEMLEGEGGWGDDDVEGGDGAGGTAGDAVAAGLVPQEQLIRRRLRRMKALHALYRDQYWRLLEDLRRRHYRFTLRNGHGGRKEEAAAEAQERDRAGLPATCSCEDCDAKPMPLSHYCFAHILLDPKQVLYATNREAGDDDGEEADEEAFPVLCTDDPPPPQTDPVADAGGERPAGDQGFVAALGVA